MAPPHKAFAHLENTADDKVIWVPSAHLSTVTHFYPISPLVSPPLLISTPQDPTTELPRKSFLKLPPRKVVKNPRHFLLLDYSFKGPQVTRNLNNSKFLHLSLGSILYLGQLLSKKLLGKSHKQGEGLSPVHLWQTKLLCYRLICKVTRAQLDT